MHERFLLTDLDSPVQTDHNDLGHSWDGIQEYFMLVKKHKNQYSGFAQPSNTQDAYYPENEKKKSVNILKGEELEVPKYTDFIGYGYLRRAGTAWKANRVQKIYKYVIWKGTNSKWSITIANVALLGRKAVVWMWWEQQYGGGRIWAEWSDCVWKEGGWSLWERELGVAGGGRWWWWK